MLRTEPTWQLTRCHDAAQHEHNLLKTRWGKARVLGVVHAPGNPCRLTEMGHMPMCKCARQCATLFALVPTLALEAPIPPTRQNLPSFPPMARAGCVLLALLALTL